MSEELQKKYLEYAVLKRDSEALVGQFQHLQASFLEIESTIGTIDAITQRDAEKSIMVPIGSNSFVEADLKGNDKVMVNVGAGVIMKKSSAEAKETLQKQAESIKESMQKIEEDLKIFSKKMQDIEPQVAKFVQEQQAHGHKH